MAHSQTGLQNFKKCQWQCQKSASGQLAGAQSDSESCQWQGIRSAAGAMRHKLHLFAAAIVLTVTSSVAFVPSAHCAALSRGSKHCPQGLGFAGTRRRADGSRKSLMMERKEESKGSRDEDGSSLPSFYFARRLDSNAGVNRVSPLSSASRIQTH